MMQSIKISIDMVGERALESIFDNIQHIPDDFRPAWERMATDFWMQNMQTFSQEGPGWRPLSAKYKAWKDEHYPGQPILVRTGMLRLSLTTSSAPDSIFDVRPHEMTLGTSVKYAMYHQTGNLKTVTFRKSDGSETVKPPGTFPPKRPPVVVTPTLQRQWNNRLVNWLREEIDYRG